MVCQRNENGEVSLEKWNEKDINCCVPRPVISETQGTTESASVLIFFFFIEAEAHKFLTLCGLRAIFLEADGELDGVLSTAWAWWLQEERGRSTQTRDRCWLFVTTGDSPNTRRVASCYMHGLTLLANQTRSSTSASTIIGFVFLVFLSSINTSAYF